MQIRLITKMLNSVSVLPFNLGIARQISIINSRQSTNAPAGIKNLIGHVG